MHKVPPRELCWGKISSCEEEEGNIKAVERQKGKGKQYHLSYDIKAVGKNIKLERGLRGTKNLEKRINI